MDFTQWIEAMGLTESELRDDQLAKLRAKYDAEKKTAAVKAAADGSTAPPVVPAPAFDLSAVILAHELHVTTIEGKAAEYAGKAPAAEHATLTAAARRAAVEAKQTALREQWPAARLKAEHVKAAAHYERDLILAATPKGPAIHSSTHDTSATVIEAAMCQSLRLPDVEKHFGEPVLQAAHSQYRGRVGLQEVIMIAASQAGYPCRPGERIHSGNCREVLQYAIQAAGTLSLPGILSNVANKELLAGYMEEDQAWREISAVRTVSDFKQVTAYRLLDDLEYEELPPGGTIKHGALGEESYTRQARTYAKMFALDRTDIINDDLGALDDLRTRLGRGAARKFNNVFWTRFVNNSTFFTAARANYFSGATTNLGTDGVGLGLGIAAFDDLRSTAVKPAKTGMRIGGFPTILLVPPELEVIAVQLYTPIAAATTANVNIHAGKYRPVKVHQLSDSNFTGYSATAWYLLRNPAILAAMVVSFLNGVQTPIVESADVDFDQLGIQFRGYHDFGCDQAEYLAGVKSKGAA